MGDTTSIDDLPMGNGGNGGNAQNVVLTKTEAPLVYSPTVEGISSVGRAGPGMVPPVDHHMNEAISGVQRAAASGLTMLPTRDIPMNPNAFTHDPQVQPNYLPPPMQRDYINEHQTMSHIMAQAGKNQNRADTLEVLYQEFQGPILIGILYFIFQMPAFRAQVLHFVPSFFGEDGNYNLTGLVSSSVLFSLAYFIIMRIMNRFTV